MKSNSTFQNYLVTAISYAYILLFIYAAVSKYIDYENFRVQLGQSPLLGAYAEFIVWSIPLSEILIAVALSFSRFQRLAFFTAFTLMVMFTAYIYIILHYSSFVPCSCGGILEKMSWNGHLFFNLVFIFLALIAIFIKSQNLHSTRKTILQVIVLGVAGTVSVIVLFFLSENSIKYHNGFIRRIPHSPVNLLKGISLEHNSYYIAGYANGKIYLGNNTAPKYILAVDSSLTHQQAFRLNQDNYQFPFASAQVQIKEGYYYFADGTVPVIYRGKINDWNGKPIYNGTTKFSIYEVIDTVRFTVRALHPKTGKNCLALIDVENNKIFHPNHDLLEKQIDGIFDTDGLLSYNPKLNTAVYTYYYRNQYLLTSPRFDSIVRLRTIDTLKQADLKFAHLNQGRTKKWATQPEKINTYATTAGNFLYIKSKRLGKYDRPDMLEQASIIDVYRLDNNSYQFSFYFYHHKGEEIRSFKIYDDLLVGLTKQYLVVGRFKKERFNPLD